VPYRDLESVPHRIVADHVRSVTMCIADGILPANDGAGYVIKMLIRRAARQAWLLGVRRPVLFELVAGVAESMGYAYPEVRAQQERIAASCTPRRRSSSRPSRPASSGSRTCSTASATRSCPATWRSTCGRPTASRST
jgi:hypothetical protein